MKSLFLFLLIIGVSSCNAPKKVISGKNKKGHLIGLADKQSFQQAPFRSWFDTNFETYQPDSLTINTLKKELTEIKIKGFIGTWCGDSQRETPHFYKILEQADFNFNNLELIAVNKSKKTPNNLQKGFRIKRVPTFIFFKNDKEIGRYVEFARESLEKDMLKIVSGKVYKHSYQK
ncbi:thioredoxin family protein [uncultured Polaribacter sp.]|uniref:thioredoxin family protein n=1 Tax=uncultured Polaribacter sp. TaxID=174711 RepID=UPI00261A64A9|nr:thioredoxin family protein [uncultured Polaribacter sp.]